MRDPLLGIQGLVGWFFARPIVVFLYGRGAFANEGIQLTSQALFYAAIGMIGYGLKVILSRVFYALQDTKTPMVNSTIAVGLNIVLNFILAHFMGIGGLALATSLSAIVATILLIFSLRKKIGALGFRQTTVSFIKIVAAASVMGVVSRGIYNNLFSNMPQGAALIIVLALAAALYFFIILFMRIEEIDDMLKILRTKFLK